MHNFPPYLLVIHCAGAANKIAFAPWTVSAVAILQYLMAVMEQTRITLRVVST